MGPRGALQERRVLYSSSEPQFDQTEHALTELSTYEFPKLSTYESNSPNSAHMNQQPTTKTNVPLRATHKITGAELDSICGGRPLH